MNALPLRLNPGDDLRGALQLALVAQGAEAAFVVSGIGSLSGARVRFAGASVPETLHGDLEILTLAGSLSPTGSHLHISIADATGKVFGGHVSPGCTVRTTVEVLIALLPDLRFSREHDPATGYPELVIRSSNQGAGRVSRDGYQYTVPSRSSTATRVNVPRPHGPPTQRPERGS